jgi:Rieske Fe-S protein
MREINHPIPGAAQTATLDTDPTAQPERRSFLKWAINGLGLLFGAILGVPAILYLIDPRHRPVPIRGLRSTGVRLTDLEIDKPIQAVLRDVRQDAWTLHPNDVVGRVWLVKRDKNKVDVFTTVCPHLGCSVNFEASVDRFICPCHNGTFDVHGHKVALPEGNNPAPRDMDILKFKIDATDVILVEYQVFRQGQETKELKA